MPATMNNCAKYGFVTRIRHYDGQSKHSLFPPNSEPNAKSVANRPANRVKPQQNTWNESRSAASCVGRTLTVYRGGIPLATIRQDRLRGRCDP